MKPLVFPLSISLVWLTACGSEQPRRAAPSASTPVAVQIAAVSSQEWPEVYEATGTVRARTASTISSKVMDYVQQVNAQVGDRVREGQILVTLDARDLEAGVPHRHPLQHVVVDDAGQPAALLVLQGHQAE